MSRRVLAHEVLARATAIACARALGSPAPEMHAQHCAIESIWHSSFVAEPSGVPSSK